MGPQNKFCRGPQISYLRPCWQVNSVTSAPKFNHKVKLRDNAVPVRQKLRRIPLAVRDEVKAELEKMIENDVIERVDESEWVSNPVVVRKSDGKIRLCIDLREVNKAVIMDAYPLPHLEEIFLKVRGCSTFSVIDMKSAFLQLPLHESSRHILHLLLRMAYTGLKSSFWFGVSTRCFPKTDDNHHWQY